MFSVKEIILLQKATPKKNVEKIMKNAALSAKESLLEADGVISIKTDNISYLDFNARADLSYHGKTSASVWIDHEIKGENQKWKFSLVF